MRAESSEAKLHYQDSKQTLELLSERFYKLESESIFRNYAGHQSERKNDKKISDLKDILSQEQQKSEDYLEKALHHEKTCGELMSTVAAMQNNIDELKCKIKDIELLESMFCELKEKYATSKIDNSSNIVDIENSVATKNAEIDRLNSTIEKAIYFNLVTSGEPQTERRCIESRQKHPRA